jgi:hypothetical protein
MFLLNKFSCQECCVISLPAKMIVNKFQTNDFLMSSLMSSHSQRCWVALFKHLQKYLHPNKKRDNCLSVWRKKTEH